MSVNALKSKIHLAFDGAVYPGDDYVLTCKKSQIDYHPFGDTARAAEIFMGKQWQEVDVDSINKFATAALNLSAIGAAYFVPSIMLAMLQENANDNLFMWLNRYMFGDYEETYAVKELLSPGQISVIHDFLVFLGIDEAKNAAEQIWHR